MHWQNEESLVTNIKNSSDIVANKLCEDPEILRGECLTLWKYWERWGRESSKQNKREEKGLCDDMNLKGITWTSW